MTGRALARGRVTASNFFDKFEACPAAEDSLSPGVSYGVDKRLFGTRLTSVTETNDADFNDYLAISTRRELPAAARARYAV